MTPGNQSDHQIYETWAPIIETTFGPIGEKRLRTLCRYAHYHSLAESANMTNTIGYNNMAGLGSPPPGAVGASLPPYDYAGSLMTGNMSLLPMCLSVLAKVKNLDDVKLTSGADSIAIERHQISWDLFMEIIQDLKNSSLDAISIIEEKLIGKAISFIENKIVDQIDSITGGGLVDMRDAIIVMNTNTIIEGIMTISEGTFAPKMALKLAFGFKIYK